jgi:hypothetical protein
MQQAGTDVPSAEVFRVFHQDENDGIQNLAQLLAHEQVPISVKIVGFRLLQALIQTQIS